MPKPTSPVVILMADDDPDDLLLTADALREADITSSFRTVNDGRDLMSYLNRTDGYTDRNAPRPDLVLLDWNLPVKHGKEVLSGIKTDPDLRTIPVVILTSSAAEEDILKAYDLSANCYITKPVDFDQFYQVVRSIEDFWFSIVKLPSK